MPRLRHVNDDTRLEDPANPAIGPNAWLIDEMYEQFLANPGSVSQSWQEFFADYGTERPASVSAPAPMAAASVLPEAVADPTPAAPVKPVAAASAPEPESSSPEPIPIRGAAARTVTNMESSLDVPTATSFREVPARLLEVNRGVINGYLKRTRGGKVSYTHIIGYAIVRAIADAMPAMNAAYAEIDGKPHVIKHDHVGLGIAVDVEKRDGSRSLLVPCVKNADTLDFRGFVDAYEDLIHKVRSNKLSPDDFAGTTVSLTNPGTIGTVQSVPRLMEGQGLIVGVGTIAHPTSMQAADPSTLAGLGVSKVVTVSSTYDHRIIQGAESGMFLKKLHELLLGEDDFYVDIFRAIGVPYEAVKWRRDVNPINREEVMLEKQGQVNTLINTYRSRGHLIADLDPLRIKEPRMHPELDPATYGLTIWDLEREFLTGGLMGIESAVGGKKRQILGDMLGVLRNAYCRTTGIEYMHISEPEEKRWIQQRVEGVQHDIDKDEQLHILERLNAAEALEKFLATKYVGQKRFGIEGAESTIPILDKLLNSAADSDASIESAVIGMAHRGRLNILVNIVGKEYGQLFDEFEGAIHAETVQGSGDVKYHLGQQGTFVGRTGNSIPVEVAANPSHLEAVNPVVIGMARAKMDRIQPPGDYPVLPILIHGDAAFAGQGVVAETLNLSNIQGYRVGGTIHVIINNQLGFTTMPVSARSSEYSTDVAKMVQAPIFHVNGDDPEACVWIAQMAFDYRQTFKKDVVIDMICYRRHGHNEGDDPSYTQPLMYRAIENRRSVRKLYTESLLKRGDIDLEQAEKALEDFQQRLQQALDDTREGIDTELKASVPEPPVGVLPSVDTSTTKETLDTVYHALSTTPDGFTVHPKLAKQFQARDQMYADGEVDWALGEAFALGSLLVDGVSVRLAGQDSRRGTFSHRHSTLMDYELGTEYQPLGALEGEQYPKLWIYDSLLSEYAALGFEYGYSVSNPEALVMWEAQFGDFINGAQIIIDQFIVAAADKWKQRCGLVMLLPHGYEGQGPEHSSARIERFLDLAAEDNLQICNATTAAQLFHLLRRQIVRKNVTKPLVIFTPKSLLRSKHSRSRVSDLTAGTFLELLDDPGISDPGSITRVVFCSGKVSYEAMSERDKRDAPTAIVRIEQLYPWPADAVAAVLYKYSLAEEVVWLQEEPENMGPWSFTRGRLFEAHGKTHQIRRVSRYESASPATGTAKVHSQEQSELFDRCFDPKLFS